MNKTNESNTFTFFYPKNLSVYISFAATVQLLGWKNERYIQDHMARTRARPLIGYAPTTFKSHVCGVKNLRRS